MAMMLQVRVRRLLDVMFEGAASPDQGQRRYAKLVQASIAALAARGLAVLVTFVSVPLTVGYLGNERYGAWAIISTLLAWFGLADIGIGNGLTNAVAEAYGTERPERAQAHVATAIWLLAGLALVLCALVVIAWPFVNWANMFNLRSALARDEIGPAIALGVALFALSFPLSVLDKIYASRQEGAIGNGWSAAANLASLGGLLVATHTRGGLVALVAAISGARFLMQVVSAMWLFGHHCRELVPSWSMVNRKSARLLTGAGGLFFLIQIAALILFNTDNLIIARCLSAEHVTPYNVSWTLFTIPTLLVTLSFPYLWPAYAEAFARRDAQWIARTFRVSLLAGTGVTVATALPLVLLGGRIIRAWAGSAAVPPAPLLLWMGAWAVILAPSQAVACLLNAAGRLRGQVVYGMTAALVNVALSIMLARVYGITGVIAATVIAWLACGAVPAALEGASVLARLARDDRGNS